MVLCLSGGGYRAALFHLGAMRRLHEVGLLEKFDTWSCVSGGSILAGFLATTREHLFRNDKLKITDWEADVAEPFRAFVKTDRRSLQTLQNVSINLVLRKRRVASYLKSLTKAFGDKSLERLPKKPNLIFCATDMAFGVNWVFEKARVGSYQAGYFSSRDWPVAKAVAASSCFPPVFGPFPVDVDPDRYKKGNFSGDKATRAQLRRDMMLTDGGLYDNLGTEPLLGKSVDGYILFVSDAGAPFEFSVARKPARLLLRYASLAQEQGYRMRLRFLQTELRSKKHFCYWTIKHHSGRVASGKQKFGYSQEITDDLITRIRTDLDCFSDGEAMILENHGYACLENSLHRYAPAVNLGNAPKPALPHISFAEEDVVTAELANSHKRISIGRLVRSVIS